METEDLVFWERLRNEQTCEILNEENNLIYLGKVHLTDRKALIEVSEASGGPVPPVLFNTKVKLKLYFSGIGSQLLEGEICGSTPLYWRLDHLRPLHNRDKRENFRQRVAVPGQVLCVNGLYKPTPPDLPDYQVASCHVEDLSLGGLLVRCREVYEVGDWLMVMDVSLLDKPPFTFTGQVRWAEEIRRGEYHYGCQFIELVPKEQDRLFQAIFELQRMNVQSRRRG